MSVKNNIRKLRKLTNTTQKDLADIAGVSRSAVSLWEIGKSEPRMGAIQSMADHFHIRKSNIIEEGGMDKLYVDMSGRLREQLSVDDEESAYEEAYRNRVEFGDALGEILQRRNVSNAELAYRIDVPTSYVDDIVNCTKHDVSLARAFQIADALGLSLSSIVSFVDGDDMINSPEEDRRLKDTDGFDDLIIEFVEYLKRRK